MASSSRSLINSKDSTSLPSSSRLDLIEYMPTPKRIKTASTSLPSSSSSSASPPNLKWTYDVFLSFRGEDTRKNFVDHLFMNLTQKGINTFRDEERLEQGKEISPELLKAIKESRFAIIIFSENYASSSWCLDELVKIIDCKKETGQIAYPVFYKVDPSNVRNQKESFAKAFDKHLEKNVTLGKMKKWKKALSHAGSIAGWDTRDGHEAKIIQEIVEKIFDKLSHALLHVDDHLIGMKICVEEINTRLNLGSNDVKFVGIHGLGGIGKTTTAKVIYNQISYQFEGCSYLANVRETYEKEGNLVSLQNQLIRDILKVEVDIGNDDRGSPIIQHRLNYKKVLIILDDVDHVNQLEKLTGKGKWFGPGSRIIITTRDQHLLNERVQRYEVKECDRDKSLEIFSWKAFNRNYPPEDYKELSNQVVRYAQGLPLALTVLGSHLRGRSEDAWRGAISQLSNVPNREINDILKISYEGLEEPQKDVFLDIACFFIGEDKDEVMEKLDSFDFYPSINIPVLKDKSLITVSAKNELMMHDLVRDMGRHIVRKESPKNPGKRSRLWNTEDIRRVLEKNMATEAIEGIQLYMSFEDEADWSFKAEAFMEMKNLRFLEWYKYPCEHLALDFPHDKLVYLSLRFSSLKLLWNGRKADLPHLKSIDLSWSEHLREFPDVTGLPKLEELSLRGCEELVEIHPSVWVHKGLKFLGLSSCNNLVGSFPNKIEMESLETLDLEGCKKMKKFPKVHGNMKRLKILGLACCEKLDLSGCSVLEKLILSDFSYLEQLHLSGCSALEKLILSDFLYLEQLHLSGCSALEKLDLSGCSALKQLSLSGCSALEKLDLSFRFHLEQLNLSGCSALEKLDLWDCSALEQLSLSGCSALEKFGLWGCSTLEQLNLSGCSSLEQLDLSGCSALEQLNLSGCSSLEQLDLSDCSALEQLPENIGDLKSLVRLNASRTAIKEVPASIKLLDKLRILSFSGCRGLKLPSSFYGLPSSLTYLELGDYDLTDETFPSNIECLSSLETLDLSENNFESLPTNITQLPLLTRLNLEGCGRLKSVPELPSRIRIIHMVAHL